MTNLAMRLLIRHPVSVASGVASHILPARLPILIPVVVMPVVLILAILVTRLKSLSNFSAVAFVILPQKPVIL
jgi:hypothetical protein